MFGRTETLASSIVLKHWHSPLTLPLFVQYLDEYRPLLQNAVETMKLNSPTERGPGACTRVENKTYPLAKLIPNQTAEFLNLYGVLEE